MLPSFERYNPRPARSNSHQRRFYKLQILQQPVRARMCGFGDRDRRLLTPPVIVELLVHDSQTGLQTHANEVDTKFFVLNADLWNSSCTQELNIVMHPVFCNPESASNYPTPSQPAPIPGSSTGRSPELTSVQDYSGGPLPSNNPKPTCEMAYTRNLIGALAQSASKLKGIDGHPGIFFIFHDLSIRTEGVFCLRFSFLALGNNVHSSGEPADVLASTFSQPFQVYSAKKFPGMLGPSPLTKHFASQRVKIPTRTRKPKEGEAETTDEDGDEDDA